jgi:hypothetical protein
MQIFLIIDDFCKNIILPTTMEYNHNRINMSEKINFQ